VIRKGWRNMRIQRCPVYFPVYFPVVFPKHPLSRLRTVLRHIEKSLRLYESVKRLPSFGLHPERTK
jgi:hypothetical protein